MNWIAYMLGFITKEELTYRRVRKQSVGKWLRAYKRREHEWHE